MWLYFSLSIHFLFVFNLFLLAIGILLFCPFVLLRPGFSWERKNLFVLFSFCLCVTDLCCDHIELYPSPIYILFLCGPNQCSQKLIFQPIWEQVLIGSFGLVLKVIVVQSSQLICRNEIHEHWFDHWYFLKQILILVSESF